MVYNIEKKLNYLKKMQHGKIPEEYQNDAKRKKYQTLYEKYEAMYNLLYGCEEDERNCIEFLLSSRSRGAKDLKNYEGIVIIFLTAVTIMFSLVIAFFDKLWDDKETYPVQEGMGRMLVVACVVACIAIIIYFSLDYFPGKKYRDNIELLEILKKVNEKKKEDKVVIKEKYLGKDLKNEKVYYVTIYEKS